jgi:DNA-binding response OmpR family regulator
MEEDTMIKILIVEDEFLIANFIKESLSNLGYFCKCIFDGEAAATELEENTYDLILLDVMLPDGNGYSFCQEVRQKGMEVPIIFLTAVSEEANVVQGLELGADDYVAKPYRVKELLSRIAANIRRYKKSHSPEKSVCVFGKHTFVPEEFRLLCDGKTVECTGSELRLLKELINNEGIVLTRNVLLERLFDTDDIFVDDNTLSVYMNRLRSKLGEDAGFIETVRGIGYRFVKNK